MAEIIEFIGRHLDLNWVVRVHVVAIWSEDFLQIDDFLPIFEDALFKHFMLHKVKIFPIVKFRWEHILSVACMFVKWIIGFGHRWVIWNDFFERGDGKSASILT